MTILQNQNKNKVDAGTKSCKTEMNKQNNFEFHFETQLHI
jgi:hypothetical protein